MATRDLTTLKVDPLAQSADARLAVEVDGLLGEFFSALKDALQQATGGDERQIKGLLTKLLGEADRHDGFAALLGSTGNPAALTQNGKSIPTPRPPFGDLQLDPAQMAGLQAIAEQLAAGTLQVTATGELSSVQRARDETREAQQALRTLLATIGQGTVQGQTPRSMSQMAGAIRQELERLQELERQGGDTAKIMVEFRKFIAELDTIARELKLPAYRPGAEAPTDYLHRLLTEAQKSNGGQLLDQIGAKLGHARPAGQSDVDYASELAKRAEAAEGWRDHGSRAVTEIERRTGASRGGDQDAYEFLVSAVPQRKRGR